MTSIEESVEITSAQQTTLEKLKEKVAAEQEVEPDSKKAPEKSSVRPYVVLRSTRDVSWTFAAEVEATSAEGAVRALFKDASEEGTFVAVPKRNWNPVTVKVEQTTTIKIS
jgi:hypothetical protein